MANYIVTDTELTAVANAIRAKGGTSESLVFPSGFVSAINNIGSASTQSINCSLFSQGGVAMRDWHINGTFDGQVASIDFTCTLAGEDLSADTEYQMLYLDPNSSLYEQVDASATRFYAEDSEFDVWFDTNGLSLMPHADVYDGTTISIAVSCLPEPGEQMD